MKTIRELRDSPAARSGRVEWIGVRPARRQPVIEVERVQAIQHLGLEGDHRTERKPDAEGKRHVTLFQWEHLSVIAAFLGREEIAPAELRRNIGISGMNLLAVQMQPFRIGEVEFHGTGSCHPCSRMQESFGEGGYNAVRGHGGITARVLSNGVISVGNEVV